MSAPGVKLTVTTVPAIGARRRKAFSPRRLEGRGAGRVHIEQGEFRAGGRQSGCEDGHVFLRVLQSPPGNNTVCIQVLHACQLVSSGLKLGLARLHGIDEFGSALGWQGKQQGQRFARFNALSWCGNAFIHGHRPPNDGCSDMDFSPGCGFDFRVDLERGVQFPSGDRLGR